MADAGTAIVNFKGNFGSLIAESKVAGKAAGAAAGKDMETSFAGGVSNLASNASRQVSLAGGQMAGTFSKVAKAASLGFAAIGVGGVAGLAAVGSEFHKAFATIRVDTGKTGAALKGLDADFKAVLSQRPENMKVVASTVADLNRRLGLTGAPLQELSKQLLRLSGITKTDVAANVENAAKLFTNFGVTAGQQKNKLDELFRTTQLSGIGFAELSSSMTKLGPVARIAGLSFEDTAGLVGSLSKAGVDAAKIMPALSKAIAAAAKEGKPAAQVFRDTFTAIKNSKDDTEAAGIAAHVFGLRAGPQLAGLIRSGTLSYQDLVAKIKGGSDTIQKAAEDTASWSTKLKILKNDALVQLEPIATRVFDSMTRGVVAVKQPLSDLLTKGGALALTFGHQIEPAIKDVWAALSNLAQIGAEAVRFVAPLVEGLAMIGGAVVVGAIRLTAAALDTVTGFLARNKGLVDLLMGTVVAFGALKAWALIASAVETIYIKWLYLQGAIGGSEILAGIQLMGAGFLTMGTDAGIGAGMVVEGMGTVAASTAVATLGIGALIAAGISGYTSWEKSGSRAKKALDDLKPANFSDGDLSSLRRYNEILGTAYNKAKDAAGSQHGFAGSLKATADRLPFVNTGTSKLLQDQSQAGKLFNDNSDKITKLAKTYQDTWVRVTGTKIPAGKMLGLDSGAFKQTEKLINSLNLDPAKMTAAEMASKIKDYLKSTAEAAGYRGPQIKAAMSLSPEELKAQAKQWDALAKTIKGAWSSQLDVVGAFSGRDTAAKLATEVGKMQAGVAESVAKIRSDLAAANDGKSPAEAAKATIAAQTQINDTIDKGKQAVKDYTDAHGVSADSLKTWYSDQTAQATQFSQDIGTAMQKGYDPALISRLLQAGPEKAAPILQAMVAAHGDTLKGIVNDGETALGRLSTLAVEMARIQNLAMNGQTDDMTKNMALGMKEAEAVSRLGAYATADAVAHELGIGAGQVQAIAKLYGIGLVNAVNPVLTAVGKPIISFAQQDMSKVAKAFGRNTGGPIPGPNVDRDVVPAMLTPGEYVIRKSMVDKMGVGAMAALNAGQAPNGWTVPGFAVGGQVTGNTAGLRPEFLARLQQWAGAVGQPYNVGSGYRTVAEQQVLYAKYLAGKGPIAAVPGSSMHNYGLASDGNHWGDKNPGKFGLSFAVPGEAWHVQPIDAKAQSAGAAPNPTAHGFATPVFPKPPAIGPWPLAQGGEGAMGKAYQGALDWAGSQALASSMSMGPGPNMSGAGAGAAAGWIRAAIAATGVPDTWFNGLMTIAQRESSFNPNVANIWDSNAKKGTPSIGLMQTIQPTFDAYKLPGHNDIHNPVDNAIASIRYIQKRYGDISKVQQANANMPPKGYNAGGEVFAHRRSFDQGGVLEKGWNMVRNDTGAPEHLKPAGATVQFGDVHLSEKVDVDSLGRRLAFELAKGRL